MKDFLLPVVTLAMLAVGVYLYVTKSLTPVPPADPFKVSAAVPETPQANPPGKRVQAALVKEPAVPPVLTLELPPPDPQPPPAAPDPPPKPPLDPAAIRVGMPARQVVELYGDPDVKVVSLDGGLLETYFYKNTTERDVVRIQVRGGRVVIGR